MLHGAIAASITPLRGGGAAVDEEAIPPLVEFLAKGGMTGILALGTTGEGVLLAAEERRRVAERFVASARGRLDVAVHCGAHSTAETVALCEHAASIGAAAVAVIGPSTCMSASGGLDEAALLSHFSAAARACAPTPFYLYEFASRAGFSIPVSLVKRFRDAAPNFAGMKVSNTPWDAVAPFVLPAIDVFIGAEALVARGMAAGAKGAVSGLAAAYPKEVAALVRDPNESAAARIGGLRASFQSMSFPAAMKAVLARRGVPVRGDVRAPMRPLTAAELARVAEIDEEWSQRSSTAQKWQGSS